MSSRLASLLVQEGLVSARRMADAFQRQVIYGGTLDTILLEMDAVDEPTLVDALGRATGLPIDAELPSVGALKAAGVLDRLSAQVAGDARAVPVNVRDGALRVLVTDPPERRLVEEIGGMLGLSMESVVVPEHRFVRAMELVYDVPVPARFASLAAKVQRGRPAKTVPSGQPESPVDSRRSTVDSRREEGAPREAIVAREVGAPREIMAEQPTARAAPRQPGAPEAIVGEVASRIETAATPAEPTAISLDEALRQIEAAMDRTAIFEALARGTRSRLSFAAVLTVHGNLAVGRIALGDQWLAREAIAQLSVSLEKPSPFRAAAQGRAPYLGRVGEDTLSEQALSLLGRKPPLPAVVLPLVLRDRAVALLYADAEGAPVEAEVLAELTNVAAAAGRLFQRIILRAKSGEFAREPSQKIPMPKLAEPQSPAATGPAAPKSAMDGAGSGAALRQAMSTEGGAAATAAAATAAAATGSATAMGGAAATGTAAATGGAAAAAAGDAGALLERVLAGGEDAVAAADKLLALGSVGVQAVVDRLPGPLHLDRHTERGPTPPVAEHGPLLAVLSRFGRAAVGPLLSRLEDRSVEVRYYATLACAELRAAESVDALAARLFDRDASVRRAASTGLSRFPASRELTTLTERLRGDLPGPDPERQRASADALGSLHDVASVPRLIELVKHEHSDVAEAARRALVEIAKQDFGTSRWRWRGWFDRHRNEDRTEWLLEGLAHSEAEVRRSASEELSATTHQGFGYRFDAPKREREDARRKWIEWLRTQRVKQPR